MKTSMRQQQIGERAASQHGAWPRWMGSIGLAVAVAVAYFLAARLSLALLTRPEGVAVFWPAAGIASGTLIALGPRAGLPVALAVVAASTAASLLGDRSLIAGVAFALCNAGEALLVAWLIERHFGSDFRLESLGNVVGFFVTAAVGPAISGIAATAGFIQLHTSGAPVLTTWLNWFLADALGIIMVAPLLIGLGSLRHDLPKRWELSEGTLTLAALALVSAIAFGSPAQYWYTVLPLGLLLPVLLAAHCRPVFAAAAALVLGFAVVWTTTFGIADISELPSLHDRAYAARATLLAISTCTLVLAALFAERRHREAALQDSNERLQLALDGAELGTWSIDARSGRFESDVRDKQNHGHPPEAPPRTLAEARRFVHPDDLPNLDAAFEASRRTGGSCKAEYRLAPTVASGAVGQERWVAVEGTIVRGPGGQPVRWLGVTRDITQRKQAELALAERNDQLALAGKMALVGTYTYDIGSATMQVSPGYAAIHGLPEATVETSRAAWRARVHPDDLQGVETDRQLAIAAGRREHYSDYRIVVAGNETRWIESRSLISYGRDGTAQRIVGVNIDVSAHKRAEEHLRALNAELDHRVKNVLATVCAIIGQTQEASSTHAGFVLALDQRIKSLARTHELLSQGHWRGVSLAEIARRELAPYGADNAEIGGPRVTLTAEAAQAVAMVLHELTTNAAKYGALSQRRGRVRLSWWWLRNGSNGWLAIEWREIGGPPVTAPSRRAGYGTSVVRELVPFELGGKADLVFAADGVRCRLEVPADCVNAGRTPSGASQPPAHEEVP